MGYRQTPENGAYICVVVLIPSFNHAALVSTCSLGPVRSLLLFITVGSQCATLIRARI